MKTLFCAPENPNAFFNRNLCRINWLNLHNWLHVFFSLLLTHYFSPLVAITLMYGWELLDGIKPHYSHAPVGSGLRDTLKRNLLYSDKFSMEDAIIFNPAGILLGMMI